MTIDPAVKAVMQKINRTHGEDLIVLGSRIVPPVRETITSGSLSLDAALGGGWVTNHWIEVVGRESSGKTLIVLKTIAANQRKDPNWTTVWFASEDFIESYAKKAGVDLTRVIIEEENTMETVYDHAIKFLETRKIDCVVIDSLPALVPSREEENTMKEFQPGLIAFLTGKFFRMSNPHVKRSLTDPNDRPVTGFIVNQWRSKLTTYGDPRTTPGGEGKNFFYFQRVDVRRKSFIENTRGRVIGQTIEVQVLKNKYGPPRRLGQIDAYIEKGNGFLAGDYDVIKDLRSAAEAYEVITPGPGRGIFSFDGQKWRGRPGVEAALSDRPELRSKVRRAVIARSKAKPRTVSTTPVKKASSAPKRPATRRRQA